MSQQLTIQTDPALVERWPTLRAYIGYLVQSAPKPLKSIAADMDLAPSTLSRKLNPSEGDTQRLNVDDLERLLAAGDHTEAVLAYVATKFACNDRSRTAEIAARAETLLAELARILPTLKDSAR